MKTAGAPHRVRAGLAAAVFVLVACSEQQTPPVVQNSFLPDSAEQMMFTVTFHLTDQGVRRADVKSDTTLLYNGATRAELRGVNTTFFTPAGEREATLTAHQGTYLIRLQTMEARGNVIVVSTDGRKLETEQLKYDPARNEITSDSAFTLTTADGITQGVGFVSDPEMITIRVLAGARSSGHRVTIPKK